MKTNSTISSGDTLLDERQAAELLNLSCRTLQAWRAVDAGPRFIRAGRAVRYRRTDLLAWVEANAVAPTRLAPASREVRS
ncbi:hypothetical protein CCR97_09480 [Rhodoplanes elegans]|uniref:Helix-turn-helix domain-containing protein n=1 Tax=Rhodoplanes elegans TaxID=29408 RepID=A0A327KQE5_9BRAD|nr:helix-turn-helix domain-containing protein [Rhodoplanes elegans]MBK5958438.1 hypothetical protein [Rhodoplanes elegans]RAI41140.1 hypothetical protein CH338_04035 [Rhodoplanes elegans]